MSCLGDFTCRAHKCLLVEQFTGAHTQLAAHHLLIEAVVTVDYHLVDTRLRTLDDVHFEVDRVGVNVLLNRHEVEEEVAIVHVEVGNGIIVFGGTLVEELLVVHVARLDTEDIVEHIRGVDGVSHPVDARDIVFLSFLNLEIHIHLVVIVVYHAVAENLGIAVAKLVVFVDDELLVGLVVVGDKLLLAEKLLEASALIGLLHHALELAVAEHLVTVDVDFVHLHLVVLIDHNIHNHLVLLAEVFLLIYAHGCVLEALAIVVFLDNLACTGSDIGRNLVALGEAKSQLDILALALFHAYVVDFRDTWLLAKLYFEPRLVAADFLHLDFHRGEELLAPEALCRHLDFITGNLHLLSHRKTRVANDDIILIVIHTGHLDAGDFIFLRHSREDDFRVIDSVVGHLGSGIGCHCQESNYYSEELQSHREKVFYL